MTGNVAGRVATTSAIKEKKFETLAFSNETYWILGVTIQMKATEQYFPVVLLIMLYKWF